MITFFQNVPAERSKILLKIDEITSQPTQTNFKEVSFFAQTFF